MPYYKVTVTFRKSHNRGQSWHTVRKQTLADVQGNTETAIRQRLERRYPKQLIEIVEIHGTPQKR